MRTATKIRPVDVQKIILRELERQQISPAELQRKLALRFDDEACPRSSVFRYCKGEGDVSGQYVGQMLAVLGLTIKRE